MKFDRHNEACCIEESGPGAWWLSEGSFVVLETVEDVWKARETGFLHLGCLTRSCAGASHLRPRDVLVGNDIGRDARFAANRWFREGEKEEVQEKLE